MANEIDKTLRPIPWTKYLPGSAAAAASEPRRKWCHGVKPPAAGGTPQVVGLGPDDALAIVEKMRQQTDMPVTSISQQGGVVQALARCCPTRSPDDCGTLIVRFGKQNGTWTVIGSRELPGE